MRELEITDKQFTLHGNIKGIKLCCMIFFYSADNVIRAEIPEYHKTMVKLTNNAGVILCPECVISTIRGNR